MKRIIIVEQTLSDMSKVYDIHIDTLELNCMSKKLAEDTATQIAILFTQATGEEWTVDPVLHHG